MGQSRLRKISRKKLTTLPLRELARMSGINHPQTVRHYLEKWGVERKQNRPVKKYFQRVVGKKLIKQLEDELERKNKIIDRLLALKKNP